MNDFPAVGAAALAQKPAGNTLGMKYVAAGGQFPVNSAGVGKFMF